VTEKTYGLNVLLDLCGGTEEAVQSLLPHYVLRNDGLWLDRHASDELALAWDQADAIGARRDLDLLKARRLSAECVGRSWTPSGDSGKPALPIPFNVRQFTAFSLAGGGMALIELFDFGAVVDEGELNPLPADASENRRASHADLVQRLRAADHAAAAELEAALQSLGKDAKDAKELVRAALPLLGEATAKFGRDDAGVRSAADWLLGYTQAPPNETAQEKRGRLLNWFEEETQQRGKLGALERVTNRERERRPRADRSNIGKDIKKARTERATKVRASGVFRGLGE